LGGFSIWGRDGAELAHANLPCRNLFWTVIKGSNQFAELEKSIVWKCPDCIYSEVRIRNWLNACKKGLEWIRTMPDNWTRPDPHNAWSDGSTDKEVAVELMGRLIKGLEVAKGETAILKDEFIDCYHENCKEVEIEVNGEVVKHHGEEIDKDKFLEVMKRSGIKTVRVGFGEKSEQ